MRHSFGCTPLRPVLQSAVLAFTILLVTVSPARANSPPQALADATATHAQAGVLVDVLANDQDVDGDLLTITITTAPLLGTAAVQGDGTVLYTPDPAAFEGSLGDSFAYQVSDGRGGTALATVTVSELPVPVEMQPLAPISELYTEDFSGGWPNPSWVVTDFGQTSAPSDWQILNGELAQLSNIWDDVEERGTYAVYTGGTSWTDYRYRIKIRSSDDDRIGVLFRYQDSDNHYRFDWRKEVNHRELVKFVGGTRIVLAEDDVPYRSFDDYLIEIRVEGSSIEVFVDTERVFSVVDTSFADGGIGVNSHGNQGSYFDNIEVVALPVEEEPVLFEDEFSDGDLAGWTLADVGRNSGPSNWQVTNGELVQSSNIYGGFIWGLAGGSAIVDAGRHWTDYRLRLKLRATDDDSVVVYLRFQDYQNNYAFHWNKQANVRMLRKMVGGVFTDFGRESGGYLLDRDYVIELVAEGNHFEVWIDGEPVITVDDPAPDALLSGTVGLGTEAMQSAIFDNVRVTAIPPQEVTP